MVIRQVSTLLLAVLALTLTAGLAAAQEPPAALPAPQAADASAQPFIFQELSTRIRYERDGRGTQESYLQVKIQSDLGIRQWGQMTFLYTPLSQELTVPLLEVRKADGTTVRPGDAAITDAAVQPGAGINMFEDLRQTHITVPSLSVGDTLAVRLVWKTHTPTVAGHFWFEHAFARAAIVLDERLEIDLPDGLPATIRAAPDAPAESTGLKGMSADGRRLLRWKTVNMTLPNLDKENVEDDGDEDAVSPAAIRVSTFTSWDGIVSWYDTLASKAVAGDTGVRSKALELTKGLSSDDERIRALYEFVSTDIRYVSLSFGLGRFAPHTAAEVLKQQYGDCKDKHTLLAAMLKAIGIEAFPVLANADRRIDSDMPSPGEFNHLLTVIPRGKSEAEWIWLDTTPGLAPYGMLLENLRDRDVLVVGPAARLAGAAAHANIRRTPPDPPFALSTIVDITGTIDTIGAIKGTARFSLRGDAEIALRSLLMGLPPDQQIEAAKGIAASMKLDGSVTDVKIVNLASTRQPLIIEFSFRRAGYFKGTATGATLTLPLDTFDFPYATEADWKTRTRGKLSSPARHEFRVDLRLPAGHTPIGPVGIALARDGYEFESSYRNESGRIVAERAIQFKVREIPAASAAEYMAFVRAVKADEAQLVDIAFDTTAAPVIPTDATAAELYSAGFAAFQNNRFEPALAYWNGVVKLAPKHESIWDALGLAYERLGRRTEAIEAFRRQTQESPYHSQAFKDLARVLKFENKHAEARDALIKHITIAPLDGQALSSLGSLLVDEGNHAAAAVHLEKAAVIAKTDAWTHARLGAAYAGMNIPAKARASFELAVKLKPSPEIWTYSAWQLAESGVELAWAEELARTSLKELAGLMASQDLATITAEDRGDVERVAWSWDAIGWIAFQNGDTARAERYIKAASTISAEWKMMDHLGQIYEKQARLTDAASAYLTALSLHDASTVLTARARRILGEQADLKQLIAAAPGAAMRARPIRLTPAQVIDGRVEVRVMLKPDGSVAAADLGNGDETSRALGMIVQGTTFPVQFPDDLVSQLLTTVGIECHAGRSECLAGVLPVRVWKRN